MRRRRRAGDVRRSVPGGTYLTTNAERRAEAVHDAIAGVGDLGFVFEPIREMERIAVEPLPELDDFLPCWRDVVAEEAPANQHSGWDNDADRFARWSCAWRAPRVWRRSHDSVGVPTICEPGAGASSRPVTGRRRSRRSRKPPSSLRTGTTSEASCWTARRWPQIGRAHV